MFQLSKDLLILPHADATSIGERGINLSGGQKARVSIARALYVTDADIYVFDDSLASVDVHVGSAIFEGAIKDMLKDKARIMALSSNYHLLPQFSRVIVVADGKISADGPYDEIVKLFPQYAIASDSIASERPSPLLRSKSSEQLAAELSIDSMRAQSDPLSTVKATAATAQPSQFLSNFEIISSKRESAKNIMTVEDREQVNLCSH